MALSLSSAAIVEKNKLTSSGAWIILLKVVFPDLTTIRLARNTEDVVWPSTGGNTYTAFPFEIDDAQEEGSGAHSILNIRVGNVTRTIQTYMEQTGNAGGVGSDVDLYVVHSDHLDLTTAEIHETFVVTSSFADSKWAVFELSARNQVNVIFPQYRFMKNFCRWSFRDYGCGYSGATSYTTCNKTLSDCRLRGNVRYFGGFPGIPEGRTYVDTD